MNVRLRPAALMAWAIAVALFCLDVPAQSRRGWGGGRSGNPISMDRGSVPQWELDPNLPHDRFTFARLKYRSWTQQRSMTWYTDFRDSDLNLSWRLHQLTALKV